MAENKKRIKGWSYNGQEIPTVEFDQTYKQIAIVDKVVKTGEGEHDFSVVKDVIVTEQPIDEVVQADAESVGVENIMRQVLRTGDMSLLPVDKGNAFVDALDAPESLMELKKVGQDAQAKFDALPEDLTKGLDMKSFVESLTQEQFDAFIKAVSDKVKGNEGNE